MWRWLFTSFFESTMAVYKDLREEIMNSAKNYIDHLETDGIYLASESGTNKFIPWNNITCFTLNTHSKRYSAVIDLKEGNNLIVRITEPFVIAQRIYKVLFNHGDSAHEVLPEFKIN